MSRTGLLVVVGLSAVVAFVGCEMFETKPPEEVVDDYAQGQRKMADGDYKEAAVLFERASRNTEGTYRTDALLLLGDCRMKLKDYAGAQQAYQQAQVKARTRAINARAKAGLGDSLMAQKRYTEAAAAYEKALSVSEKDINGPAVMLHLGKAYIRSGKWALGRDRLVKLAKEYPSAGETPEARDIVMMPSDTYSIQAGAYASRADAQEMVEKLRSNNIVGARIVDRSYSNAPFAVRVLHFVNYSKAQAEAARLKPIAPDAYVVP